MSAHWNDEFIAAREEASLKHYGVKGMEWNKHKKAAPNVSDEYKQESAYNSRKNPSTLSTRKPAGPKQPAGPKAPPKKISRQELEDQITRATMRKDGSRLEFSNKPGESKRRETRSTTINGKTHTATRTVVTKSTKRDAGEKLVVGAKINAYKAGEKAKRGADYVSSLFTKKKVAPKPKKDKLH